MLIIKKRKRKERSNAPKKLSKPISEMTKIFNSKIKSFRKSQEASLQSMGEAVGINGVIIGTFEAGRSYPNFDQTIRLAKACEIDLNSFKEMITLPGEVPDEP